MACGGNITVYNKITKATVRCIQKHYGYYENVPKRLSENINKKIKRYE